MTSVENPESTPASDSEEQTNTTDVREAIARAKEAPGGDAAQPQAAEAPASEAHAQETHASAAPAAQGDGAQQLTPQEHASVHTEPYSVQEEMQMPSAAAEPAIAPYPEHQGVAAAPATAPAPHQTSSIDAEHPMAALYIQQPMPPNVQGNRLGGVLISLLATVVFAAIFAGLIALYLAPSMPPSTFLQDGWLPHLTSLGFVIPIAAFFVAMVILVLIFNRAGWWAYVLGGFFVALIVWAGAAAGYALSPQLTGQDFGLTVDQMFSMATTLPVLAAAVTAREVSVWFGAWIGARGRKVKARNAAANAEYEEKLQEVQAKLA